MRHNADWQLHNLSQPPWEELEQARWSAVPRDFTEVRHRTRICGDGWFMQVSAGQKSPTPLFEACASRRLAPLPEGSDKADNLHVFFALSSLCANIYQEPQCLGSANLLPICDHLCSIFAMSRRSGRRQLDTLADRYT